MLRTIWYWIQSISALLYYWVIYTWGRLRGLPYSHAHECMRRLCNRILAICSITVQKHGLEHLPKTPAVYVANHLSAFDIFVLTALLPGMFRWVAKEELFSVPFAGAFMRRMGFVAIRRQKRREAIHSLSDAVNAFTEGHSLIVFPEGTRSKDGNILPFKPGAFATAIAAQVPVVPIALWGTDKIMMKNSLRVQTGTTRLHILKPLSTTGLAIEDRKHLAEDAQRAIATACLEMSAKTTQEASE